MGLDTELNLKDSRRQIVKEYCQSYALKLVHDMNKDLNLLKYYYDIYYPNCVYAALTHKYRRNNIDTFFMEWSKSTLITFQKES